MEATFEENRTDWPCVAALIACIGVFGLALGLTYPLLSLMMAEAGMSDFAIGLNGAMTGVGLVLSTFFLPRMIRLLGGFRIVVISLLLCAGGMLLFPLTDPEVHWFPLRIIVGACLNAIFVVSEAWLNTVTAERIRGRVIGVYATMMAAGFALGPLLLVILGGTGTLPFVVGAAIVGGSVLAMLPLRRRSAEGLTEMRLASLGLFMKVAALLTGVVFVFAFFDAAAMTLLPIYMLRSGFSPEIGAAALSALLIGMVAAQFPVGWLLDRFSRPGVIAGCSLVAAAGCALLPLTLGQVWGQDWLFWPLLVVLGGASFALYTGALTVLGERFSGSLLMAGSASFAFIYGIGGGLGPLLGGTVLEGFGPDAMMGLFGLVFLVLALLVRRLPLALGPDQERRAAESV
ncbi:MFS transporter [Pelagibius litoralis]|uniref:MFS transporter n=1 Tax=Pelagibius litoralis TaxID=374515 RepID=A0A967C4G7_9PROT|nr:MFS transporter [Pelagibius litoralis]NIA68590.1 MFS transporter [Pelagibius litoralis]